MRLLPITTLLFTTFILACPASTQAADEAETFVFAYRLVEPQTQEFEDAKQGEAFVKALSKLGCKSKVESHEGHMDVIYQQPRWTLVTLQSEELVHKWQEWLKRAGCETLHSENPEHEEEHNDAHQHEHAADTDVISFQAPRWVAMHFEKAGSAAEFIVVCKALGCEYQEDAHEGHADINFRCVKPRTIECAGHEAAESRAKWLTKLGFAVQHNHE